MSGWMGIKVWSTWKRRLEMDFGYLAVFYPIGSIPVAWLIGKLVGGEDIRELGSGNAGVMNVALNVSRWAGMMVFLAEAAKGFLVIYLARRMEAERGDDRPGYGHAVVGTRWSIWIRRAGGRGNTLGVAAMLVLSWPSVVISGAIWLATRLLTRSSFWATRGWILSLPAVLGLATMSWWYALAWGRAEPTIPERAQDRHG